MAEPLPRHAMVTVSQPAWLEYIATRPELTAEPPVVDWVNNGHPLIARRPGYGETEDLVPLGLPLPPAFGKQRIAVSMASQHILAVNPPPLLSEASTVAPPAWQECIECLVDLDPSARVFGSLAWQFLTGLPYVTSGSDLDLLWTLPAGKSINVLLDAIAAIAGNAPMRIDGEIIGEMGGVNWHELHAGDGGHVLLKGPRDASMVARTAFLAAGAV